MDEVITFVYHHGGSLVTKDDGEVVYEQGDTTEKPNEEVETLDVNAIRNYHKVIGYDQINQCYWHVPGRPMNKGLRVLESDSELMEMAFYANLNGRRIDIYYEHGVSVPNPVEECPKLIEFPPSSIVPLQVDPQIPVDVDSDPEVCFPHKSPPKTQPTSERDGTSRKTNFAPKKCLSPKSSKPNSKPKSAKPATAKPKFVKPTTPKPQSIKPINAKPNALKPQTRSATEVSPGKGKKVVQTPISGGDGSSSSSDSYDSAEDNLYMPRADELSSEDDDDFIVTQARKKDCKKKKGAGIDMRRAREEIMVEDDGLVVDSDSDVDLEHLFGNEANVDGEYRKFTCTYCGQKGPTKRTCPHKKKDNADIAAIVAAEAAKAESNNSENNAAVSEQELPPSEIDITQLDFSQVEMLEEESLACDAAPVTRPDKLPLRRRASNHQQHPHMDPMQGASAGTTKRWSEIIRTMPTPGFIPPRKK
ncbi:hypothetical protein PIB30_033376 [Stylosanthes scabra]|uniref:PB1-like domain-containing protein n=1 Tax=Stylosanthes scabra TaxID=79078 RepID=A0ABU6ZC87_9FABA|nr:hypothetical protein [Stylosanthes scabra]